LQTSLVPQESGAVDAHYWPVQSLAFGNTKGLMASGDTHRNVKIWFGGKLLHELRLSSQQDKVRPTERIRGLAFSPGGDTLYVACGDLLRGFSVANGEVRWEYQPPRSFGFLIISPVSLAVSSMGDVAASTDAGRILVFTSDGALFCNAPDNDSPRQIAFLGDDNLIGTDSFSVCTWRAKTAQKLSRRRLAERTYGFAANADGSRVALRTIHDTQIWDTTANVMLAQYSLTFGPPVVAISKDGSQVAMAGVTDIDLHTIGGGSAQIPIPAANVRSLKFTPDGGTLVGGCSDGSIRFWEIPSALPA
jgi:WD40 repeat protein